MAQNLARSPNIIRGWLDDDKHGLLRQYHHPDRLQISLHPYDSGHLKVVAAIASVRYQGHKPLNSVHDSVAVTNFVKFSFFKDGKPNQTMDANPPKSIYDDMWDHFCEFEVDLLNPDIIIGVGNDVYEAIKRNLKPEFSSELIKIPFPGRLNWNSKVITKGKHLMYNGDNHGADIERFKAVMDRTPDNDGKIAKAIKTDWYYFGEMDSYFQKILICRRRCGPPVEE